MSSSIKLIIHSIDKVHRTAIVSISDGEEIITDKASTRLNLNVDGTANTVWLTQYAKKQVLFNRLNRLEEKEKEDMML